MTLDIKDGLNNPQKLKTHQSNGEHIIQHSMGIGDLNFDAWGHQIVVEPHSLFAGIWTFNVPNRLWHAHHGVGGTGWTEQAVIPKDNSSPHVKSVNGELHVTSDDSDDIWLSSKRCLRYQADRGYKYASAFYFDDPTAIGYRRVGSGNFHNGIFFELRGDGVNWTMHLVRLSFTNGAVVQNEEDITALILAKFPSFDPAKGNTYDIQMQWRGVGDFYAYVNQVAIYHWDLLGTTSNLSISNPALPITVASWGAVAGSPLVTRSGCVDVASYGGQTERKAYSSAMMGKMGSASTTGTALLAVRIPKTISYNGHTIPYTRDMDISALTTFAWDEFQVRVWLGRQINLPNLDALIWRDRADTFYQLITNDTPDVIGALHAAFTADKANMEMVFHTSEEKDTSHEKRNPNNPISPAVLTPGDIFLIEIETAVANSAGVTMEFGEYL